MARIGTGLIGYGTAGAFFHAPLIAAEAGLALRRVASSRRQAIEADHPGVNVDADPAALIAATDIELVVIATPNQTHHPLAMQALAAGKHVVIDKPMALDPGQARELIDAAADAKRMLSVFHNRRWDDDFLTVQDLLARDVLGQVNYLESHFDRYRPAIKPGWREGTGEGTGVLFDLGSHLADQALHLFGMPEAVTADVLVQRPQAAAPDYFHIQLHYGRRRVVLHGTSLAADHGARFMVHGERGSFTTRGLDGQEALLRAGQGPGNASWPPAARPGVLTSGDGTETVMPLHTGAYTRYYAGVARAIVDGVPPPVTGEEALDVMRVIVAAQASSMAGRTMALD
ncbi:oxidoreductase [Pinirhizobacter sp.]|jgi:scyllo-inositol 2-dehydrogenase (NADP+)|uniref:oxidoreductase n=1 Tax=Pinirhizobacter sp. TaxID=2950432 RepID=UPI002F401B4C